MKPKLSTFLFTSLVLSFGCAACSTSARLVKYEKLPAPELQKICNAYGNLNYPLAGCAYAHKQECFIYVLDSLSEAREQLTAGHEFVEHCVKGVQHTKPVTIKELILELQ